MKVLKTFRAYSIFRGFNNYSDTGRFEGLLTVFDVNTNQ